MEIYNPKSAIQNPKWGGQDIMKWCEEQPKVDYLLAMGTNNQLQLGASDILERAKADYEIRLEPVTKLMESLFSPDEE